jgi:ABC-2 type transport system permease protein
MSRHIASRMLLEFTKSRRVLWLWVVFPVSMLVLFGWVRTESLGGIGPAFAFTAPGILVGAALFFSCLGGSVSVIVGEKERGTLHRLRASPVGPRQYFAGLTLAHVMVAVGQAVLVYGITFVVGGRIEGSVWASFLVLVLCATTYVGAGFIIGTRYASGTEEINGTVAGVGVPLLVLGGTFFSTDLLPPVLLGIARLNPVFHMNRAFTAVARGQAGLFDAWPSVLALGAFTAAAWWLAGRDAEAEPAFENESRKIRS